MEVLPHSKADWKQWTANKMQTWNFSLGFLSTYFRDKSLLQEIEMLLMQRIGMSKEHGGFSMHLLDVRLEATLWTSCKQSPSSPDFKNLGRWARLKHPRSHCKVVTYPAKPPLSPRATHRAGKTSAKWVPIAKQARVLCTKITKEKPENTVHPKDYFKIKNLFFYWNTHQLLRRHMGFILCFIYLRKRNRKQAVTLLSFILNSKGFHIKPG